MSPEGSIPPIPMPAGVAVSPVQRPLAASGGVAQPGDPSRRPLRTEVLAPRRTALHNRHRAASQDRLDPNLVDRVLGDDLLAVGADCGDIETREHAGDYGAPESSWRCAIEDTRSAGHREMSTARTSMLPTHAEPVPVRPLERLS